MHVMKFRTVIDIGVLLTSIIGTNAFATDKPYTLNHAPWTLPDWNSANAQTCARVPETGLRAYIFPMETKHYQFPIQPPETELVIYPAHRNADGVMVRGKMFERSLSGLSKIQTYFKRQVVGYLNDKNEWIDAQGRAVTKYKNFYAIHGTRPKPYNPPTEEWTRQSPTQRDTSFLTMENRMQHAQACTYTRIPAVYKAITETIKIPPGKAPLTCLANGGVGPKNTKAIEKTIQHRIQITGTTFLFTDATGQYGSGNMYAFGRADKVEHQGEKCFWKEIRE